MFLSICIPAYNAEKTIVRALEAIPKNNNDIDVLLLMMEVLIKPSLS